MVLGLSLSEPLELWFPWQPSEVGAMAGTDACKYGDWEHINVVLTLIFFLLALDFFEK